MTAARALTRARRTLTAAAVTAIAAACLATSVATTSTATGHDSTDVTHAKKEWKASSTSDATLLAAELKVEISTLGKKKEW